MAPYDIFLSFRGPDTRTKFTDHLYNALTHKGYRTFRDNDEIEMGEPIKSELQKAIGNSKIFVVILSKNYANSTACLFELQMILEQWKKSDHFVLPVFYEVDPLEVKKQAKHLHFRGKKVTHEKVKGWSAALEEVAGMAGMVSRNQCHGEAEFIEEIIDELKSQLGFWDHVKACLKRGACTMTGGKHHHHHHHHHHSHHHHNSHSHSHSHHQFF
ncbi:disease resistance protein Roq1-like [Rhododendron vialii]|uniref:disease resistance protein Roq1-like n=1 Tax=Rhododendron vialii TaxID=182163 RepID=UPI00265EA763|nr:disease resistance protein Roq1-like [Rhododendron vialii]